MMRSVLFVCVLDMLQNNANVKYGKLMEEKVELYHCEPIQGAID